MGVSLFICITGFIFTVLTTGKSISYLAFLKNRFIRLFPLIFLVLLFGMYTNQNVSSDSLFLFMNLLGGGVVFGTWTLVVEAQFYISYPFIRDRIVRATAIQTLLACGTLLGLFVFFRLAAYSFTGSAQIISYYSIFGHADAFICGILAGLVYLRLRDSKSSVVYWGAVALCVLAALAAITVVHWFNSRGGLHHQPVYPTDSSLWIVWPTLMAVIFSTLTGSYCLVSDRWHGPIARGMAYLGAISYSTYMLHFITLTGFGALVNKYLNIRFFEDDFANAATVLIVLLYPPTILVSAISYELIEKAFFRHRVPYLSPTPGKTPFDVGTRSVIAPGSTVTQDSA